VTTRGIVVGDFEGPSPALRGFNIQDTGDADPLTSNGIFIYNNNDNNNVSIGDEVVVSGVVSEYYELTEITATSITKCGTGSVPTTYVTLPVPTVDYFERFEGMLVTLPQRLVISEYFNYDRFGEIILTLFRHTTPTALFEPGSAEAAAAAQAYLLDSITLDDGRTNQNPDPAIHPNGLTFDLTNRFRGGDRVMNVTGVMDYSHDLYRIQPTKGASYQVVNPRPATPPDVGGSLKVVSMNVLNYFSTLGSRGADTIEEFQRQRAKTIAAIIKMNPDIAGLVEIENNDAALIDLVAGLNDATAAGTYAYIPTGPIGKDEIKVALIYKPATVSPMGTYAILDSSVDPRFLDDYNRPVLAQTFIATSSGGVFTVAVNHLKSKGSDCKAVADPDLGDGAGNCNLTRLTAAQAEVDWLASDPTGSNDTDFMIIGDLNSYDKEAPIDAILAGADDTPGTADDFVDMLYTFQGEHAYSYVFDGQIGYLDYAASKSLAAQITGVDAWHVNADEPDLIDYDMTFKQDAQDALYAPDEFRYSDHDPILIGLALLKSAGAVTPPAEEEEEAEETPTALPETGFAPGRVTALPLQSVEYSELGDLWLEIPALGVKTAITGVPIANGSWDVTWLGDEAGWLEGSAFPTASGNAVLTGHVWDALDQPGVFEKLADLRYGDQVIVHNTGKAYIYEVRELLQVQTDNVNKLLEQKDRPWVTLVTCRGYDEESGGYLSRVLVRAVLVEVK